MILREYPFSLKVQTLTFSIILLELSKFVGVVKVPYSGDELMDKFAVISLLLQWGSGACN